jgi:hypothetical protein
MLNQSGFRENLYGRNYKLHQPVVNIATLFWKFYNKHIFKNEYLYINIPTDRH